MPAIIALIHRVSCSPLSIPSALESKDHLTSGAPYLLGVRWAVEDTFSTNMRLLGDEYPEERCKATGSALELQPPKGIPSNIVNEVKITSLTHC